MLTQVASCFVLSGRRDRAGYHQTPSSLSGYGEPRSQTMKRLNVRIGSRQAADWSVGFSRVQRSATTGPGGGAGDAADVLSCPAPGISRAMPGGTHLGQRIRPAKIARFIAQSLIAKMQAMVRSTADLAPQCLDGRAWDGKLQPQQRAVILGGSVHQRRFVGKLVPSCFFLRLDWHARQRLRRRTLDSR